MNSNFIMENLNIISSIYHNHNLILLAVLTLIKHNYMDLHLFTCHLIHLTILHAHFSTLHYFTCLHTHIHLLYHMDDINLNDMIPT